jgi:NADH-quinone oxidoreductase subunit F
MDLHIQGPEPTPEERAVVDSVLGQAVSAWAGGIRNLDKEGRISLLGGHEAHQHRDKILPAFHAIQSRFGWITPGAFNYVCRRLSVPPAEAYGVATFYHLFSVTEKPRNVVHVCDDIACRLQGAEQIISEVESKLKPDQKACLKRSPCLGQCERGTAALALHAGEKPLAMAVTNVTANEIIDQINKPHTVPEENLASLRHSVPQSGQPGLRLLRRIGQVDPESLQAYRDTKGYEGLKRAIAMGAQQAIEEVVASKLVGRGGAAFPGGRKAISVAKSPVKPKYVICNADESEPGTFKDRVLMEGDPFAVIEGMTIAGFAVGSEKGYIYIRGEYPLSAQRMERAITSARSAGLLGKNIMGAGFNFDIEIRRGAGAYICGEEMALLNSIEGKRGEPRNKPPFPVDVGLFGKPTLINNVETLVNVPWIIREGGVNYARIGTPSSAGPKLFCISGHVAMPGVYEVEFGPTLRQMIELAGGVPGNKKIKAILLGGAAGSFVGPDQLDVPLTFEGMKTINASIGSGVIMVFDETVDLGDILARIAAFFRDESCGQCVPCRIGTVRQEELVQRVFSGKTIGDLDQEMKLLKEIAVAMRDASICGLGQTAANAIESAFDTLGPHVNPSN